MTYKNQRPSEKLEKNLEHVTCNYSVFLTYISIFPLIFKWATNSNRQEQHRCKTSKMAEK